jgi:hypothetical protein
MGHLISAGTGLTQFKTLAVSDPDDEDPNIIEAVSALELATQEAAVLEEGAAGGEAEASVGA